MMNHTSWTIFTPSEGTDEPQRRDAEIEGEGVEGAERFLRLARDGHEIFEGSVPRVRVLIVDQDVSSATSLSDRLTASRFDVAIVTRSDETVQSALSFQPH